MKKKNIFITTHTLRLGGVERSLIGLLNAIDYSHFDVDLFLFLHDGEMMPLIPNEVNLLPESKKYAGMISSVKNNLKWGNFNILKGKQKAKSQAKKFILKNKIHKQNLVYDNYLQRYNVANLPQISDKQYDLAISFLTPHYITAHKVNAQKKIAWIHTDYSFFEFDKQAELEMWSTFDYIASISEDCTKGFVQQFQELKSKIVLIENILDPEFVIEQANVFTVEDEMPDLDDELNLLSVGRFSHQKNFDNVPEITKHLLDLGLKVKWYLVGYGGEESLIRNKIQQFKMQDNVIILGKKDNPYPYMQACDFYIQPSRYEGKAVTVREAQILAKPVVITSFATSKSQLKSGVDGLIVPLDNKACAAGIADLIKSPALTMELIKNSQNSQYGNLNEIQKIYDLMK